MVNNSEAGADADSTVQKILLQVPSIHACYADHFPGNPIVPGALLLKWIMALLKNDLQRDVVRIKQIKFLAPVKPGEQLQLEIKAGATSGSLLLTLYLGETQVLKGTVDAVAEVVSAL